MAPSDPEIKVLPDPAAIAAEAAERIVHAADEAIALSGRFRIGLSGGSTPKALFQLLASDAYRDRIDWSNVEVFFADERCVPPDHAESNYRMARETLLSKVKIPGDNVYRMRGEVDPRLDVRGGLAALGPARGKYHLFAAPIAGKHGELAVFLQCSR